MSEWCTYKASLEHYGVKNCYLFKVINNFLLHRVQVMPCMYRVTYLNSGVFYYMYIKYVCMCVYNLNLFSNIVFSLF